MQYKNTARMSLHHPLLGVGPGNWAVVYPKFASNGDPSLTDDGMTANPWPSSDWMTFLSERGPVAFVLLALAVLCSDRRRDARPARGGRSRRKIALHAWALLGTLAVLLVVGTFDAVLLLPAPALVGWALLGALSPPPRERRRHRAPARAVSRRWRSSSCSGGGSRRRAASAQIAAMGVFETSSRASGVERALALDPGSYRIHARIAQLYVGRGDCKRARPHARAAKALFPSSPTAKRLVSACGGDAKR